MAAAYHLVVPWLALAVSATPAAASTLVVALEAGPDAAARVAARSEREAASGNAPITSAAAIERLTGVPPAERPGVDGARATELLAQAREREANFDSAGAATLRQRILAAFAASPRPDAALRFAAGSAALELAVAQRETRGDEAAFPALCDVARRFPETKADPRRYAPEVVALYEHAADAVAAGPRGKLVVAGSAAGDVYADGNLLGHSRGHLERSLPSGDYRVWLIDGDAVSLPHGVEIVAGGTVEVQIDLAFERCVDIGEVVALTCAERWRADLGGLAVRVGADRAVGVPPPGLAVTTPDRFTDGILVADAAGVATATEMIEPPGEPVPSFSPLYLLPLGGAQFVQGRPVFGAAYLGGTIGLTIWHIVESIAHSNSSATGYVENEPALRTRRIASGVILYSFVVATVVEAIVWGQLFGE